VLGPRTAGGTDTATKCRSITAESF